jgi:excisionase family DNA binding protein
MSMETYDINQAAAIAKVHPETLRKMAVDNKVPSTKIGRRRIFPKHLFDSWIENRCLSTDEKAQPSGGARFQSLATRLANQRKQQAEKTLKSSSTESVTDSGDSTSLATRLQSAGAR